MPQNFNASAWEAEINGSPLSSRQAWSKVSSRTVGAEKPCLEKLENKQTNKHKEPESIQTTKKKGLAEGWVCQQVWSRLCWPQQTDRAPVIVGCNLCSANKPIPVYAPLERSVPFVSPTFMWGVIFWEPQLYIVKTKMETDRCVSTWELANGLQLCRQPESGGGCRSSPTTPHVSSYTRSQTNPLASSLCCIISTTLTSAVIMKYLTSGIAIHFPHKGLEATSLRKATLQSGWGTAAGVSLKDCVIFPLQNILQSNSIFQSC